MIPFFNLQCEKPLDWRNTMPRALHTKPFAWDQGGPILPVWKKLVASPEKAAAPAKAASEKKPAGIALIAGYDSGSDSEDEDGDGQEAAKPVEPSPPKAGSKRKMQILMKSSARAKVGKTSDVASIFKEGNDEGEEQQLKSEAKRDKHGRKIYENATGKPPLNIHGVPTVCYTLSLSLSGAAYKKSIDAVAETLCDKLEFLEVAQISVSPLKILAIKTEVSLGCRLAVAHISLYSTGIKSWPLVA